MRLTFGPDDDKEFQAAKTALLARFETWLSDDHGLASPAEAAATAGDAGLALDWKWGYGGGDLGRWTTADVGEFLLEWCPRKLSIPPEESATIPLALAALIAFLNDLISETVELTDAFVDAMGDPSNFGMAKSLFASAVAEGFDLEDPDQLEAWMEEFNARPEEERRRFIPDTALAAPPPRPVLPPVVPPDDAEVAASRASAPILAKFAALAEFAADGRKLTQKGNFTLADARALVALLDTGDIMDPKFGSRTFRTTSAAELGGLNQIFIWARKAGVVRMAHGRVHATKKGLAMAKDPAAFFDKAVDGLLAAGPLASQRKADGWGAWPEVTDLLDHLSVGLLIGPYAGQRPFPIEDLCEEATRAVLRAFHFPRMSDDDVARRIAYDVTDIVDAFELAGVVRRHDAEVPSDDDLVISRRRTGGTVSLTPAGVVTVRRLLVEGGYEAPTAGRFTDASATELLLGIDDDDFAVLAAELEAWRSRRTPAEAAAELAAAVRAIDDPALANLALAVMGQIDLDIAGPEVRALATHPERRGFALCWLVDHGLEGPEVLFDPDDVASFVDVLAQRLVTAGPDGLCDALALAGDHERQVAVLGRLWRSTSPATALVLAAVSEVHPVKVVAKAARKALFKRRSWDGGR
jgi:hypothetical protein